jgi:Sec-independent protein translocase protein TatA
LKFLWKVAIRASLLTSLSDQYYAIRQLIVQKDQIFYSNLVKMSPLTIAWIFGLFFALYVNEVSGFIGGVKQFSRINSIVSSKTTESRIVPTYSGNNLIDQRLKPMKDLLGLGPAEIAITLVVGLVLFGPETLKSLSKDVGRAAAELKEIPKTFKEGMDEGAESSQVAKMKAIAAEKRLKRDAKRAAKEEEEDAEDDEDA